jgi:hypothetical protein
VALLCASRLSFAQTVSEPVRFVYTAPAECPAEARFLDEVAARTAKFRAAEASEPARVFTVVVDGDSVQATGYLEVQAVDGTTSRRAVGRGSCGEVVSALALITAVAIDPDATSAAPLDAAPGPASAGPTPPRSAPARTNPERVVPSPAPPAVVALPDQQPVTESIASSRPASLEWTAGASFETLLGLPTRISVGGGAFLSVAPAKKRSWVPEGRLTLLAAVGHAAFGDGVGADVLWLLARVEGCLLNAALSARVALGGCAAVDAGLLRSTGTGVAHPDTAARGWVAPGALARVRWEAFANGVVDVGGGITVPIVRYPFSYDPGTGSNQDAGRLPAVGGIANIGLGYVFR